MKPPHVAPVDVITLSRLPNLRALVTLFLLTLRQHIRGRRLLVLSLLLALPGALAMVVNLASSYPPPTGSLEFALVLNLIPHALAPLAALLYAGGIIQDDVEEQTLTYLLLRPLPRWALYLIKLLATTLVTSTLIAVFTMATLMIIALTASKPVTAEVVQGGLQVVGLLTLAQIGYCGLFGMLGLVMRRSLVIGVAYIVLFEGLLASFDTVARRLTVMYYFRVLVLRWREPASGKDWAIDLATAPTAETCVLTLLGTGLVLAAAGALFFTAREFRMKTPEGV